jgi:quercetin dioxygenase-like cupin family protein
MNTKSYSHDAVSVSNLCGRISASLKTFVMLSLAIASAAASESVRVTELMTKALANASGKEVTMITVEYAPGGADPVHRHNASAFVYVLEGSIVMGMKGDKEVTLHPGDTFYEDPNGVHIVGRNASDKVRARFVVFIVKDKGTPYFVPVTK